MSLTDRASLQSHIHSDQDFDQSRHGYCKQTQQISDLYAMHYESQQQLQALK